MRHRRNGKEPLIIARVSRVELLHVNKSSKRYPREAEDCRLPALATQWGVTFVHCIVLDSHSIRNADEIANLSLGCLGIIHQFALKTGQPHFCHVSYLGKTVSFTLSDSKIVYPMFHRPWSLHAYDSPPIECSTGDTTIVGETSNAGGSSAGAGDTPASHHSPTPPALQAFLTLTLSNAADQSPMEADAQLVLGLANSLPGTSAKRWEAAVNLFQTMDPSDRKQFCNDIFVFPEFSTFCI